MEIKYSTVIKLNISDIEALDPISVFIEDVNVGKGKIIIECYGKSWSYYWGGMSGQTVTEFFSSCGVDYLSNCLWDHSQAQTEPDYTCINNIVRKRVLELRREMMISHCSAREIFEIEEWGSYAPEHSYAHWTCPSGIDEDDFSLLCLDQESVSEKYTSGYAYLIRIVGAVQKAFSSMNELKLA